ncbi:hypothetical protein KC19_5G124700 [Ceratodon purpureus]|uniref:Oxysterol-binding protein n=1 Tax=Ceratodon purpureus TaxID=3225 RepID=A0A8T0I252_CERPU|nr:hypothetical protein KC19_5G124700 [Ceratodon purpureus]
MSFFAKTGESRHSLYLNPAAIIPIEDEDEDDGEDDGDGYVTAEEEFCDEVEDGGGRNCAHKFLQVQSFKAGSKSGSFVKERRIPTLTEPFRLERKGSFQDGKKKGGAGIVSTVMELLKGFRPGSDITKLQLPPQFNLPKSQLQVYGEAVYCCGQDYLGMCAAGVTPVDRMLAVVRFHLSTTRPAPFLKAPYNPVLGETHHVSVGELNVLCEQVSHNPPVTALYATNEVKKLEMLWWHQPVPRFYGGYVEASIIGQRRLKLLEHQETYEFTSPNLQIRFFPNAGTAWVGSTTVKCKETGLEAVVNFKPKTLFGMRGSSNKVSGKVFEKSSGNVLYELNGCWDGVVTLKDKATGITSTLYDAQDAIIDIHAPAVANLEALSPVESVNVWLDVTTNMLNGDWDIAREAKRKLEETQRALKKERLSSGTVWSPKYFSAVKGGGWEWNCAGQSVPSAPLVVE